MELFFKKDYITVDMLKGRRAFFKFIVNLKLKRTKCKT